MLLNYKFDAEGLRCTNAAVAANVSAVNYIKCHFDIANTEFDDVTAIIAVFKSATYNVTSEVLLDSNHDCFMEPEVFKNGGTIQCKLVGDKYVDDVLITSSHITNVAEIYLPETIRTPLVTPSKYEMFVAELAEIKQAIDATMSEIARKLETDEFKGEPGVGIARVDYNSNHTITIVLTDGTTYTSTTSMIGPQGATGVGISNVSFTSDGKVIVTLDNGRTIQSTYSFKGPRGDDGADGVTPSFSIGDVEALNYGMPPTVELTGTDENPVLNFGIPTSDEFITWHHDGERYVRLPILTYPPLSFKAMIGPTQEGSGTPSPTNVRNIKGYTFVGMHGDAVNIFGNHDDLADWKHGYTILANGTEAANSNYKYCQVYVPVNPETRYTLSYTKSSASTAIGAVSYYDYTKTFISRSTVITGSADTGRHSGSFVTPANCQYIRINVPENDVFDIQIELGSAFTTWSAGDDYCFYFDTPIYEGELDVLHGVITSEVRGFSFDGTEDWSILSTTSTHTVFRTDINYPIVGESLGGYGAANIAEYGSAASGKLTFRGATSNSTESWLYVFVPISMNIATTVAAWKTWLSAHSLQGYVRVADKYTVYTTSINPKLNAIRPTYFWSTSGFTFVTYVRGDSALIKALNDARANASDFLSKTGNRIALGSLSVGPDNMDYNYCFNVSRSVFSWKPSLYSAVRAFTFEFQNGAPRFVFGLGSAMAPYAFASGQSVSAKSAAQTVFGKYNVEDAADTYGFIIGNGTGVSARSNAMTVAWNGNTNIAGTLTQSSDKRLKEHVKYLGADAVKFINKLKPAQYIKDGENHVGFYAQDVESADKWGCMVGEMNGYKTLGYTEIIAPLVAYCQKLEKRISELEKQIAG